MIFFTDEFDPVLRHLCVVFCSQHWLDPTKSVKKQLSGKDFSEFHCFFAVIMSC